MMADNLAYLKPRMQRLEGCFYLFSKKNFCCVWHHAPRAQAIQNEIIILCPPIGYEYTHSYRALRRLAEHLCDLGFIVFRLDYAGTGDGSDMSVSSNALTDWVANVEALSDAVARVYPTTAQCWIGLRLGGTLALLAAKKNRVQHLVLWDPMIKGRKHIRELEAINRLSPLPDQNSGDYFESAGFLFSNQTVEAIKSVDCIKSSEWDTVKNILLITRDDGPEPEDLIGVCKDQSIHLDEYKMSDYESMMDLPHKSTVPIETIEGIGRYLKGDADAEVTVREIDAVDGRIEFHVGGESISEQGWFCGENYALFGVLSKPTSSTTKARKCIVLANSGSVHHVGPNAVYVEVARQLAAAGCFVLRCDLENVGDSLVLNPDDENHSYQSNAVINLKQIISALEQDFNIKDFVIGGICSGGYNAFHFGLRENDPRVREILVINPLTFYWNPSLSLDVPVDLQLIRQKVGYKRSLRDMKKWKQLFKDRKKLISAITFVCKKSMNTQKDMLLRLLGKRKQLEIDLKVISDKGLLLSFVFSQGDGGIEIVNANAGRAVKKGIKEKQINWNLIRNADHTFSTKSSRMRLIAKLVEKYGS